MRLLLFFALPVTAGAQATIGGGRDGGGQAISIIDPAKDKSTSIADNFTPPEKDTSRFADEMTARKVAESLYGEIKYKTGYVATIDPILLIFHGAIPPQDKIPNDGIVFGVRKPYYRLGKNMRVAGTVDLKYSGSLAGIGNRAVVTVGYDLRKYRTDNGIRGDVSVVKIAFSLDIPFNIR